MVGPGRDPDGDRPLRPEELGLQRGLVGRGRSCWAGPAASSRADRPARPPARRRSAACGSPRAGERPSMWTDIDPAAGRSVGQGGSKNCAISSRQRVRPNQAASRLNGQTAGSRPRRRASTSAPGSGRSRTSREHSSARSRKRRLVRPRVAGPPEDHGQLGLEQRPDGARGRGRWHSARRGARSARSRPAAGPGPAGGRAPRPRPRSDARGRPTRAARSRGRGTAR